jgi:hypothetical protein
VRKTAMTKTLRRIPVLAALLLALAMARPAAAVSLTLVDPAATTPGTPAGWGFTLQNDTASYMVVTSVSASATLTALGTFTDFAAQFQFLVVAPSGSANQTFNNGLQTGVASLLCGTSNASAAGTITITYDLYSSDPTLGGFDPLSSGVSFGNTVSGPANFGTTPVQLMRFEIE